MHDDKLNKFLKGDLNFDEFQNSEEKSSTEKNFIDSYKKVIEQSEEQTLDYNPFEKIESFKKKRLSTVKWMLPYAATIVLAISLFVLFQNKPTKNELTISDYEMAELQQNTELALLYFSKELNACMAKFEDAKQMKQPVSEIKSLKDFKVKLGNPIKNFKIN